MGIFKKIGTTTSQLAGRLFKSAKTGTSQTQAEQRAAHEQLASDIGADINRGGKRLREAIAAGRGRVLGAVRGSFAPKSGTRFGPTIPAGLKGFLLGQRYDSFTSSNVRAIQYDPTEGVLYVEYLDSRWYRYEAVTPQKATGFWYATSKGTNVWDVLRVRGSRTAHQHRYAPCSGPPSYLPLEE